jgi:hypothetical protein
MSAEAAATAASRRAETAIAAAAARQRETFMEAAATTRGAIEAAMVAEACAADASLRVALEAWREQQRRAAAACAGGRRVAALLARGRRHPCQPSVEWAFIF